MRNARKPPRKRENQRRVAIVRIRWGEKEIRLSWYLLLEPNRSSLGSSQGAMRPLPHSSRLAIGEQHGYRRCLQSLDAQGNQNLWENPRGHRVKWLSYGILSSCRLSGLHPWPNEGQSGSPHSVFPKPETGQITNRCDAMLNQLSKHLEANSTTFARW